MAFFQALPSHIQCQTTDLDGYSKDHSSVVPTAPAGVVFPTSQQDCVDIVGCANNTNTPLVVRGAGTGTTGGAIADSQSVVVSMERMNKILDLDLSNGTITVEPGVVVADIHRAVEAKGLFYPPDPASLDTCTIGGNIAENAGGPRALKYGVTRDYVLGLQGVWGNAVPFTLGGKLMKQVAGLDLIGLLVGSEGTLGVVTAITLKLIPKPVCTQEAICGFAQPQDAVQALLQVRQAGVRPSTAEFMVQTCVEASVAYMQCDPLFRVSPASVIWQVDGHSKASVAEQMATIADICSTFNGVDWVPVSDVAMSDHVWSVRRNVSLGLRQMAVKKCSEDIVVPPALVPDMIATLQGFQHASGIQVLGYGHLGDGNIHVNILKMGASDAQWEAHAAEVVAWVMQTAVDMGGSISGEHGIGLTKKAFMPLVFSEVDLQFMHDIKASVDPKNILNPGKVLP